MGDCDGDVVLFAARVVKKVRFSIRCEWAHVASDFRVFFGLVGYNFSDEVRVQKVMTCPDKWSHKFDNFDIEEVIKEAIGAQNQDIVVLHFVALLVGRGGVVAARPHLARVVEAVRLLLAPKNGEQVDPAPPEQQVPRVAQVGRVEQSVLLGQRRDNASRAADLASLLARLDQQLDRLVEVPISPLASCFFIDISAELPCVFRGVYALLHPATDAIGQRYHIFAHRGGILAPFIPLGGMGQHMQTRVELVHADTCWVDLGRAEIP